MYADSNYYVDTYNGCPIPINELNRLLRRASRHIDTLTFNRIHGIESLTEFQQETVREVCCEMAEFEYENADTLSSMLQSYSINGVSMTFGEGINVKVIDGIAIRRDTYGLLCQTGLCCRLQR